MTKKYNYEEDVLTEQVADYLELLVAQKKIQAFSHIPHETFTRNWGTKMKNKKKGVRGGVPDMLIVGEHGVLFLELKREKGGVLSDEQKVWISSLRSIGIKNADAAVYAEVARGWDQSKNVVDKFVEIQRKGNL